MPFEISGEELKRRIDKVTMLNATVRKLRQAALEAYERGEIAWKPQQDIRTDTPHWRRVAAERGIELKE
ncbi:hypothetical protein GC173_04475 [bacterium]|nr:hypothetical protein [bacterium]